MQAADVSTFWDGMYVSISSEGRVLGSCRGKKVTGTVCKSTPELASPEGVDGGFIQFSDVVGYPRRF